MKFTASPIVLAIITLPLSLVLGMAVGLICVQTSGDPSLGITGMLAWMVAWPVLWFVSMGIAFVRKERRDEKEGQRRGFPMGPNE